MEILKSYLVFRLGVNMERRDGAVLEICGVLFF